MIKFPYGLADFYDIITNNYFYIDRTNKIPLTEQAGKTLLFLRPRRFGKSLWLSTLENYYDINKADEFEHLFGASAIGKNPTPLHNQYLILKFNFSIVATHEDETEMRQILHNHLNGCIKDFKAKYKSLLKSPISIAPKDAILSLQSLFTALRTTPYKLYLLIDEYDNFANNVFMGGLPKSQQRYERLITGEGMLKTIFKTIKAGTEGLGIDRVFITGVSPIVMSDLTSGFNIADNIYLSPQFNNLCGFSEAEVTKALTQVSQICQLSPQKTTEALQLMRTFYDGYSFHYDAKPELYNPTLVLHFLKTLQETCEYPRRMLDTNLAMDKSKITYISQLPQGEHVVSRALNEHKPLVIDDLADRFGLTEMLKEHHDETFMISLLYYFGVITLTHQRTIYEELILQIPNLVTRKLYAERLHEIMLPTASEMNQANRVARLLYQQGQIEPLCQFIEQKQFSIFDNRDYQDTTELTIKTIFLTLLFNDTLYIMDSEPALKRRYADLIMLVRPDMRHSALLDILIEFKYVTLGKNNLTAKKVKAMSQDELLRLKPVKTALAQAKKQLRTYQTALEEVYGPNFLKLRTYTVVAVGYDRLISIAH